MRPMLATLATSLPSGAAWRHEVKWDGIRAIVTVSGGRVSIATRSGADCTSRFPEITGSHLADFDELVLDGEIVALVDGRPDFRTVMHRLTPGRGLSRMLADSPAVAAHMAEHPVTLMTFDVLRAAGHDTLALPWAARRELLDGAGIASDDGGAVVVPAAYEDGEALLEATKRGGIEGIVSKRVTSPYRPGVRSDEWLKSVHRVTETFVVIGWRPVTGMKERLGALLVADLVDGRLRYCGRVGTGFSAAGGRDLRDALTPSSRCPVDVGELAPEDRTGTHWVAPNLLADVTHLGRSAGSRLRQPAYKGMRHDLVAGHGAGVSDDGAADDGTANSTADSDGTTQDPPFEGKI